MSDLQSPSSQRPWLDAKISLGNVLVLASMLASLAFGWSRLETGLAQHDERIDKLEVNASKLATERINTARDMADMKADMRWIRAAMERLERELKAQ